MDYSKSLVLYSGGADSTYFIEQEQTAKYLLFYESMNSEQKKVATINANLLGRFLTSISIGMPRTMDGETNEIHALYDTQMALDASIKAVSFGMDSITMCFNADDIAIDFKSIESIMSKVCPAFKIHLPLRKMKAKDIRNHLQKSTASLRHISCMHSDKCGFCAKCKRGYGSLS